MAGIGGVIKFNTENKQDGIAHNLYLLLFGLQNRGQASAKVITQMKNPGDFVYFYNGDIKYTPLMNIENEKYLYAERKADGSVRDVFDKKVILDLYGEIGLGGVSNTKIYKSASLPYRFKMIAVTKDGYIRNAEQIKQFLISKHVPVKESSSEVEMFAKLFHFHYQRTKNATEAIKKCAQGNGEAPKIEGKYSAIAMTPTGLVALSKGKPLGCMLLPDIAYFSSESAGPWSFTTAVTSSNFQEYWTDIRPGQIMEIQRDGKVLCDSFETTKKICSFEWAYFSRPDSMIYGKEVGLACRQIGRALAPTVLEAIKDVGGDLQNCIVAPVLESGNWYGVGLCEETNLPMIPALYKNKYSLKSFILDYQKNREEEVMIKHIPSVTMIKDKEIILTDDSIVRGTTMRILIESLRKKGQPKKVHLMIGFPPKKFACPYGAESSKTLIANELNDIDEIADRLGADTLTYGTHEIWEKVLGTDCCFRCEQGNLE